MGTEHTDGLKKKIFKVDKIVVVLYYGGMALKKEAKNLDISIDARSAVPVYEQVKQSIKILIASGYLIECDRLIPIRELAGKLKINTNTIVKVYYQLEMEGYIYSMPGSGYYIKGSAPQRIAGQEQLLERLTDEYISKALTLGYSVEEMISLLKTKVKKGE